MIKNILSRKEADELKTPTPEPKHFHIKGISNNSFAFNSSQVRLVFSGPSKDLFIQESAKEVAKVLISY